MVNIWNNFINIIFALFLANMITWTHVHIRYNAIARPLSVVCLYVTFVHPTQANEIFGNFSTPFCTMVICWHPGKILQRSSQGNPSVGKVKGQLQWKQETHQEMR